MQDATHNQDRIYMQMALALAKKGEGKTAPNPMVGAVIVKDDRIIGTGYHMAYGQAHAEANAIGNAMEDVADATLYVTLEPCSHYGKTPPCADLILQRKIKRVVIAMEDPNPLVAGRGVQKLRDAGIQVSVGLMGPESRQLNEVFLKYIVEKRPFLFWKCAMTLDGKIATVTGESQWISGEASRKEVHHMRGIYTGIMVGIGTVQADNPRLTCRTGLRNPIRIVLDSGLQVSETAHVLDGAAKTILAVGPGTDPDKMARLRSRGIECIESPLQNGHVDLDFLMDVLGSRGVDSILLEGGPTLAFSALEHGLIDKARFYIAPKLLGGAAAKTATGGAGFPHIANAVELDALSVSRCGEDIVIEGYPRKRR